MPGVTGAVASSARPCDYCAAFGADIQHAQEHEQHRDHCLVRWGLRCAWTASRREGRRARRLVLNDSDGLAVHDLPQGIWEQVPEVETDGEQAAAKTSHVGCHALETLVL